MANPVPNKHDGNANRTPVKWTLYSEAGEIEIDDEYAIIGSAGALAMTLDDPTNPDMNGFKMTIQASTAQAHVITFATIVDGTNNTSTWTEAIGNSLILRAYGGQWAITEGINYTMTSV